MAVVPSPANWNVNEAPTAAMLNTRIRDVINFIKSPPMAVLRRNVTQTINNTTWTAITWEVEDLDTDGGHSTVTNTSRYTAQTAGWYLVEATLHWTANATGHREIRFRRNGNDLDIYGWNTLYVDDGAEAADVRSIAYVYLGVGDYVEVQGWQSTGGSLAIFNDTLDSRFEIRWVSTNDLTRRAVPTPGTWSPGRLSTGRLHVEMRDMASYLLAPPMAIIQRLKGGQAASEDLGTSVVPAILNWDTALADSHGGWSSSAPERYTAQVPGLYHMVAQLLWADLGGLQIRRQGFIVNYTFGGPLSNRLHMNAWGAPVGAEVKSYVVAGHVPLNAGDWVSMMVDGNVGFPQIVGSDGTTPGCRWDIRWVSKL